MTEKIYHNLKQAYSHLGLGDNVLRAHADALNSMGLVTEENLDTVITAQKQFLENLQAENDRRVTEATIKAKQNAKKGFEEEMAKKAEEEAKKAEERQKKEAEERMKQEREKEMPEWYKKEKEAQEKIISELSKDRQILLDNFKAMKEESDRLKAEKAAADRKNLIISKAKELGVPQYRIDEGFYIAEDADEAAISDYLSKVANNIKVQVLPEKNGYPLSAKKVEKAEADAIAKALVG